MVIGLKRIIIKKIGTYILYHWIRLRQPIQVCKVIVSLEVGHVSLSSPLPNYIGASTQNLLCCGLVYPGTMSVRWRGMARRRTSMFPDSNYAHSTITEDAIVDELENGNHCGCLILPFRVHSCANVTFFSSFFCYLTFDRGTRPG